MAHLDKLHQGEESTRIPGKKEGTIKQAMTETNREESEREHHGQQLQIWQKILLE